MIRATRTASARIKAKEKGSLGLLKSLRNEDSDFRGILGLGMDWTAMASSLNRLFRPTVPAKPKSTLSSKGLNSVQLFNNCQTKRSVRHYCSHFTLYTPFVPKKNKNLIY